MIDVDIREMIRGRSVYAESRTLCWTCSKACTNGCSWAIDGTPVEGWDARPTMIMSYGTQSYAVMDCPEYVKDGPEARKREYKTEACAALLEQALRIARDDYIKTGSSDIRNEIVCFLSCWMEDHEEALRKLHADRKAYWKKRWARVRQQID